MRRILIGRARQKLSLKRGAERDRPRRSNIGTGEYV